MADGTITDAQLLLLAVQQAASGPAEISTDAGTVRQFPLGDLIKAHQYVTAANASSQTKVSGLRFAQFIPGGTVQRYYRGDRRGGPWR